MKNCFITKLRGIVDNDQLLKIGEFFIDVEKVDNPTSSTQMLNIGIDNIEATIVGDGYFTDSTLQENYGKNTIADKNLYVSNGSYKIKLSKYNLAVLLSYSSNKEIDSASLKYAPKLNELELHVKKNPFYLKNLNLSTLSRLTLEGTNVMGEIKDLANNNCVLLSIYNSSLMGDIEDFGEIKNTVATLGLNSDLYITGSLESLVRIFPNITNMNIGSTKISGDISELSKLKNLDSFAASNIYGDISSLKACSNLTSAFLVDSNITGDISLLGEKMAAIEFYANVQNNITWKNNRPSSSSILTLISVNLGDDVDAMLNNQALCKDTNSRKIISVIGTRTSASDSAIATLQSKGYTVSITPA